MTPLQVMLGYLGGLVATWGASYCYRSYNEGRGTRSGAYETSPKAIFEEMSTSDPAAMFLALWPLVAATFLVMGASWPIRKLLVIPGRSLRRLGAKHKEAADTRYLEFKQRELLLQKYESEIDEFLKGKS